MDSTSGMTPILITTSSPAPLLDEPHPITLKLSIIISKDNNSFLTLHLLPIHFSLPDYLRLLN
jgi:hypothetical protein